MKITKYGHACLFVENNGQTLVVDPGCFTKLPDSIPNNVTSVVITEEHGDHFDLPNLKQILEANPSAAVFTTTAVHEALNEVGIDSITITGGATKELGAFTLHFTETPHAPVHIDSPCNSLAIQIDDAIYYPSDSYMITPNEVKILALPTSGPWYKITESIDFVNGINSRKILPTHNALNSEAGNKVAENHIKSRLKDSSREWINLADGESLEI